MFDSIALSIQRCKPFMPNFPSNMAYPFFVIERRNACSSGTRSGKKAALRDGDLIQLEDAGPESASG